MKNFSLLSRRSRRLARWLLLASFCAAIAGACANRGMMAVPSTGTGGNSGSGGLPGTGGSMGTGGAGSGGDGSGGAGSGGDGSGGAAVDAPPDLSPMADAMDARDASTDHACPTATFTFESGTSGAHLGTMQAAAQSVTSSIANHYCGQHALEITTAFSGTSGNTTKAEVLIDLAAGQQNLANKMITIHVAAIPESMPSTYMALTLITGTGNNTLTPSIRPLTSDWQTQTYTAPASATMVSSIDIQIFDTNNYVGKIYIDDLDIR
jgi:hypothetical protein